MSVTALWLIFTAVAIFGMVGYDVAIKIAADKINVFAFTAVLVLVALIGHVIAFFVARGFQTDDAASSSLSLPVIGLAVLGGIGLVMMDIGFFLGVKYGGLAQTNTLWLIGGLLLTVLIGYFAFQEPMNTQKILGVGLGMVSIYLLVSQ